MLSVLRFRPSPVARVVLSIFAITSFCVRASCTCMLVVATLEFGLISPYVSLFRSSYDLTSGVNLTDSSGLVVGPPKGKLSPTVILFWSTDPAVLLVV